MHLQILAAAEVVPTFYREAAEEYRKRFSRYGSLTLSLFRDEAALRRALLPGRFVVSVSRTGRPTGSEELAALLRDLGLAGHSAVDFVLDVPLEDPADRIALSHFPLETGLALTVLSEQLYRAFRILRNEPYHK